MDSPRDGDDEQQQWTQLRTREVRGAGQRSAADGVCVRPSQLNSPY